MGYYGECQGTYIAVYRSAEEKEHAEKFLQDLRQVGRVKCLRKDILRELILTAMSDDKFIASFRKRLTEMGGEKC